MERETKPTRIGVVGQGAFGEFILKAIPNSCEFVTFDVNKSDTQNATSFEDVLDVDILIPAIPLFSYEEFFERAGDKIKPETLIIDICSVKETPGQIIKRFLPDHRNVLMTHPLFGPQSAAETFKGHTLIVTEKSDGLADDVLAYCENDLGLKLMHMTADEHDKNMAQVHVLTFFAARGLGAMELPDVRFMTPSYNEILDLIALDETHSEDLFRTIQLGNPYAREMRERFISALQDVNQELNNDAK